MQGPAAPRPSLVAVLGRLARGVTWTMPIWVPALLLWQVFGRGLAPALAERRRLEHVAPEVEARHAATRSTFERLEAEVEAWSDPVYRERLRRLRAAEEAERSEPR
jgi:hypothetical protein